MSDRRHGQWQAGDLPPAAAFSPARRPRSTSVATADFAADSVRELREFWTAKRPTPRKLPSLKTFDALELRAWIDNLALYGVDRDPDDELVYRYRQVGRGVIDLEGADHTGEQLHQVFSPVQVSAIVGQFNAAVDRKRPVEVHDTVPLASGGAAKWDRIVLPLASEANTVDELMVLTYVERVDRT